MNAPAPAGGGGWSYFGIIGRVIDAFRLGRSMGLANGVWKRLLAGSLSCLLLLAGAGTASAEAAGQAVFEPPPDEWDWVQLTSDEWLKGEVIAFYEDSLEFESDNLGVLVLDWDDVRRLRTHEAWGVMVEGVGPLFGLVEVTEEKVIVRNEEGEVAVDRDRLVSIAADRAPELKLWRASISLGVNVRKGNSDIVEYNGRVLSRRLTPKSRILQDYIGNFNRTEGIQVANKHRYSFSWDKFRDTKTFWRPLFGHYYRDPFQNINHQIALGGGHGWRVVDTDKTTFDVAAAGGGLYIWYESALPGLEEQELSPALGGALELDAELTDDLDYYLVYNAFVLNEAVGRFKHHLLSELSVELLEDLDFEVTLVWDRTQRPEPRADGTVPEQNDFRLIVGLGWDF